MLDIAGLVVGVIGTAFGMVGTIVGVVGFYRAEKEKKRSRSVRWEDLSAAVKAMVLAMRKEFIPDVIYAPTQKSGILIELMQPHFQKYIPVIFGLGVSKKTYCEETACKTILDAKDYYHFETVKWHAYVPKTIAAYKEKRVLIVDDFAMTGEYLDSLKQCLIHGAGFSSENIRTVCLVATKVAENDNRAPNYVWKTIDTAITYLPWGRPQ